MVDIDEKKDIIEKLKLEIAMVERGGYNPSVREPRKVPQIFRDSITCPNYGMEQKQTPCTHCFLMQFVPLEHRNKDNACHYIPLNSRGDTVLTLLNDPDRLQAAMLGWLYKTIARLEMDVAQEEAKRPV